jgi:hypothetical protein
MIGGALTPPEALEQLFALAGKRGLELLKQH